MLAHFERVAGEHIQKQVQGGLPRHGIHFILKNTGKPPVFRGIGGHFDFPGYTVRNVTYQFDKFGIRVFVTHVLGDKLFGHLGHNMLFY